MKKAKIKTLEQIEKQSRTTAVACLRANGRIEDILIKLEEGEKVTPKEFFRAKRQLEKAQNSAIDAFMKMEELLRSK